MRSHEILVALVNNPRTPVGISMQLMLKLNDKELSDLAKAKGIPGALVSAARRILMAKAHKLEQKGQKH
ncbi:MAG: hypothetical protein HY786_09825 [Deltaproteobacteria bacterium]|nr:hypothetical protein [Deltaproteobacteria bacterium]